MVFAAPWNQAAWGEEGRNASIFWPPPHLLCYPWLGRVRAGGSVPLLTCPTLLRGAGRAGGLAGVQLLLVWWGALGRSSPTCPPTWYHRIELHPPGWHSMLGRQVDSRGWSWNRLQQACQLILTNPQVGGNSSSGSSLCWHCKPDRINWQGRYGSWAVFPPTPRLKHTKKTSYKIA